MIVCPSGKTHSSTWGLMLMLLIPGHPAEPGHVDLVVEVADVAEDRLVLHAGHVPAVTMSLLPVVVMMMSARSTTSSSRATW